MGYRLEISEFKDLNVGTKLFGYTEDVTKFRSHKWLLENNYITGEEYWSYGCNPQIVLTNEEFKEFIKRGNVLDLAVGVIVGGAFSSIVSSLVNNILSPILGIILGGIDFSGLSITIKDANIQYGLFIQSVIDFLIVSFCLQIK